MYAREVGPLEYGEKMKISTLSFILLLLSKLDCAVLEWFLKFKKKRGYILGSSTEGVSVTYIRIPSFDTLDFFPVELID